MDLMSMMMERLFLNLTHTHGMQELMFFILKAQLELDIQGLLTMMIRAIMTLLNQKMLLPQFRVSLLSSLNIFQTHFGFQEKATEEFMYPIFHGNFINTTYKLNGMASQSIISKDS
jgi:hypothetical protein